MKLQRISAVSAHVFGFLVLALWLPRTARAAALAKFEPEKGCYIGAFIELDDITKGDIDTFEALTRKKHASYFTYVGYGMPFPSVWVEKVKGKGAAPHIAFEPNRGLHEVQDDEYLRSWARDASRANCPIFLRWASEMNGSWTKYSGDPALYQEKFAMVSRIMREEAPNVAMVWTPFAEPRRLIQQYYPGDEHVDWVGVNIYSVYVHNGDPNQIAYHKNPVEFLQYVYDEYADRKPIHISEFAATIYCKGSARDTVEFAIEKMTLFYNALRVRFPRVKAVNWFCLDTIRAKLANNNYSILEDGRVLHAYVNLVKDSHFLSHVDYNPALFTRRSGPNESGVTAIRPARSLESELVTNAGAIAATITQPWLRGVKNGDVILGDVTFRAQLPVGLKPRGLIWQVDGRAAAITNTAPFRVTIPLERIGVGKHTAKLIVIANDAAGTQHESPEVEFSTVE